MSAIPHKAGQAATKADSSNAAGNKIILPVGKDKAGGGYFMGFYWAIRTDA